LISTYTTPELKGRGPRSSASQRIRREKAIAEQTQSSKASLTSDAARQADLVSIRRGREKAVKQAAIGMTRKRGKASLLSSQTGGAGFFQRYFK
jgi:sarcosine oxidase gamma subunit